MREIRITHLNYKPLVRAKLEHQAVDFGVDLVPLQIASDQANDNNIQPSWVSEMAESEGLETGEKLFCFLLFFKFDWESEIGTFDFRVRDIMNGGMEI